MIAALYFQDEVNSFLQAPKVADDQEWARALGRRGRDDGIEVKTHLTLTSELNDTVFSLEISRNLELDALAILLHVQHGARTSQAICRYDVHDGAHFDEIGDIGPRVPHKHVYSEHWYRVARRWDKVATKLPMRAGGTFEQVCERVKRFAIDDLKITFYDRDAAEQYTMF